jgi:pimeloyl-ACP methyl ester carboxylesterase
MLSPFHVEESGTGDSVVLLHSSGLSGRQWRRLAGALASKGFRAVVPDFTGHGGSAPWPEPQPFNFRQDVAAFVAMLKEGPPPHVVGHSYGGLVALMAALEAPEAVRSLVLFEPVAFGVLEAPADADAQKQLTEVDVPWGTDANGHERWLRGFVDYWGGEGAWAALREEARAEFRRVGWVVYEGVTSLVADPTPRAAYRVVTCPVTLMTGELSPIAAGRAVQRLGESLPNAKVVVVPGAGHMGPMTHSGQMNTIVMESLTKAG